MANMVTVHAQTNLPQFGLRAGEVGEVDEELAAGPLARGFAVIEGAPSKKKTAPAPDPVTDAG